MNKKSEKPIIKLEKTSVLLGNRKVFVKSSWTMNQGENWLICGRQGSGKSIFASALCGEIPFIDGDVSYCFKNGSEYPYGNIIHVEFDSVRQIKDSEQMFVSSRYCSSDESETVDLLLRMEQVLEINPFEVNKTRCSRKEFTDFRKRVISLLGIENLLDAEIDHLSFGESRKVLLARAILKRPEVLILDNPLQGLDAAYRLQLVNRVLPEVIKCGINLIILAPDYKDAPSFITDIMTFSNMSITGKFPAVKKRETAVKKEKKPVSALNRTAVKLTDKATGPVLVEMHNVTYTAGKRVLFKGLGWTVHTGEHWHISGPNGCGKTTLLSLITGDNPQRFAHDISVFGRRWKSGTVLHDISSRIGRVSPEMHSCFTGSDSCLDMVCSGFFDTVGLYSKCSRLIRQNSAEMLEKMGLSEYAALGFCSVSEGIQRMVLLARAAVNSPELLILDEPLHGLDRKHQKMLLGIIEKIARKNCSILYVTHEQGILPKCITHRLSLGGHAPHWRISGV